MFNWRNCHSQLHGWSPGHHVCTNKWGFLSPKKIHLLDLRLCANVSYVYCINAYVNGNYVQKRSEKENEYLWALRVSEFVSTCPSICRCFCIDDTGAMPQSVRRQVRGVLGDDLTPLLLMVPTNCWPSPTDTDTRSIKCVATQCCSVLAGYVL